MFEPAWDDEHKVMRCPVCRGAFHDEPETYHDPACPVGRLDEVRAILAPVLWDPYRTVYRSSGPERECVFCGVDAPHHGIGCPVPRRDELLGRLTRTTV